MSTPILNLGRWTLMVSFTPRLLYPRGKGPRFPLNRRLDGLLIRCGRLEEKSRSVTKNRNLEPTNVQECVSQQALLR
jgi:hypothetical protein